MFFVNLDFVIWEFMFYFCISEALDLVIQNISDILISMKSKVHCTCIGFLETSCTSFQVFHITHLLVHV